MTALVEQRPAAAAVDPRGREAIAALEGEADRVGSAANENAVLHKFRAWHAEVQELRAGGQREGGSGGTPGTTQEGPLFTD